MCSTLDKLLSITEPLNPHTFNYVNSNVTPIWLYDTLDILLTNVSSNAKTFKEKCEIVAVAKFYWDPLVISD